MSSLFSHNAQTAADINLVTQLSMGVALMIGTILARRKWFRAHAVCQSLVILLNLIPISIYMEPVFRRGVLPDLPAMLGERLYAVSTAHAVLGLMAEALGLYIVIAAGTPILPKALRFNNYKAWMRIELALWWLVIAFGVGIIYL